MIEYQRNTPMQWGINPTLFWRVAFAIDEYRALKFYDWLDESREFEASWDSKKWFKMPHDRVFMRGQFHNDLYVMRLSDGHIWKPNENFYGYDRSS